MADAGRVIGGSARGRRLLAAGPATRPLGDRVKQTLFAILEPELRGAAVLDLFAGSGAAGIEARSRGATIVTFVEGDADAVRTIASNLVRTSLDGPGVRVVRSDALAWLAGAAARASRPYDVVIVDPPYDASELLLGALERLAEPGAGLLSPTAMVVAKHFWRARPPARIGLLASTDERRFGETALTFYRPVDEPKEPA